MSLSDAPRVSVVINTLDRARRLEEALAGLMGQTYPALEVVVVNGPSRDDTAAVLERWAGRLKAAQCDQANLSQSRNVGIAQASGDIIAFLDDDAAPHPYWVDRLVAGFADPRVGAVGGFTVDNTGVRWQVGKTVCDRFGNAFNVAPHFDERSLCRPGAPYYPSLLGANCAFRADALRAIGGFDEVFAYYLDETDVCLRLVDAGWRVVYEPEAMVFHQFAPSGMRTPDRVARSHYASAVSKAYFVMSHGAAQSVQEAAGELERYREDLLRSNAWFAEHQVIDGAHRHSLDEDVMAGIREGSALAGRRRPAAPAAGPVADFLPLARPPAAMRIALVSQGYGAAEEAGIGRWTRLAAEGLAARGHHVHVLTRTSEPETTVFEGNLWVHRMNPLPEAAPAVAEAFDVPDAIAAWSARVAREVHSLKSWGLDVVSAPIWDLEGLLLPGEPGVASVVSLHTTYAMAKPFKPEWSLRPLLEYWHVDRVIAAERAHLNAAPRVLANSAAILDAVQADYGLDLRPRADIVPHGVDDPLARNAERTLARERDAAAGAPLRILCLGRFEARKGFDVSLRVAATVLAAGAPVTFWFAGDALREEHRALMASLGLEDHPGVRFLGVLPRPALETAFADCDAVLAPSRFESFGLVAVEAMAARRPVLTLAAGGLAEVVEDGVSGRLWPPDDDAPRRIADEILRLDRDRPALLTLGRGARAAYEQRFTVEAMAAGLEAAYAGARRAAALGAGGDRP
ncbi:glycosyltransferase [Caulobacter sp. KR2-114]|uniref:glycosyltransferase n=1 Tax=Caulobacter sp. KR2-114 TaxID=3400912 RepID=UPI003C073CFB